MKHFKCPHCRASQSHPECSLYSYLKCSNCHDLYRLADAIHYEGVKGAASQLWTNVWSPYETGQQTPCIYCHEGMPLQFCEDGSFAVPDRCPHCAKDLPARCEQSSAGKDTLRRIAAENDEKRRKTEGKRHSLLKDKQELIAKRDAIHRENDTRRIELESRISESEAKRNKLSYAEFPFKAWYAKTFDPYLSLVPHPLARTVASIALGVILLPLFFPVLVFYSSAKDDAEKALNTTADAEIARLQAMLLPGERQIANVEKRIAGVDQQLARLDAKLKS